MSNMFTRFISSLSEFQRDEQSKLQQTTVAHSRLLVQNLWLQVWYVASNNSCKLVCWWALRCCSVVLVVIFSGRVCGLKQGEYWRARDKCGSSRRALSRLISHQAIVHGGAWTPMSSICVLSVVRVQYRIAHTAAHSMNWWSAAKPKLAQLDRLFHVKKCWAICFCKTLPLCTISNPKPTLIFENWIELRELQIYAQQNKVILRPSSFSEWFMHGVSFENERVGAWLRVFVW